MQPRRSSWSADTARSADPLARPDPTCAVLQLYALDWKQFREWPVLPVALPERLLRDLPDTAGLEKVPC
jgi:hypothetical protein